MNTSVEKPVEEENRSAGDSAWVVLTNLSNRASWNKVRGIFSEIGCTVISGKVYRAKGHAIVKLASVEEAIKAEAEVNGHTFRDIPDVPITAQRITESERSVYEC